MRKTFLTEEIYGNMATVYGKANQKEFELAYRKGKTLPKKELSSVWTKKGIEATYDDKVYSKGRIKKGTSDTLIKYTIPIARFFIFDYEEFKKSPEHKKYGSYEPDWEWDDYYVRSPLSPKEYWAEYNKEGISRKTLKEEILKHVKE